MAKSPQTPTPGRIVIYVTMLDSIHPAMITEISENIAGEICDVCNLVVFGAGGVASSLIYGVDYSEEKKHDTWHWPEIIKPKSNSFDIQLKGLLSVPPLPLPSLLSGDNVIQPSHGGIRIMTFDKIKEIIDKTGREEEAVFAYKTALISRFEDYFTKLYQ